MVRGWSHMHSSLRSNNAHTALLFLYASEKSLRYLRMCADASGVQLVRLFAQSSSVQIAWNSSTVVIVVGSALAVLLILGAVQSSWIRPHRRIT